MQGSKLYVGNLNYSVTIEDVKDMFAEYGEVMNVNIIEGKGFGFVEMSNQSEAESAKKALNGAMMKGRSLRVNAALPARSRQKKKGSRRREY